MKLLFFGDSVTDMGRNRELDHTVYSYGCGYVRVIADRLLQGTADYSILNRGISGNRSVDLYARIKKDVWNERPDILTILVGVNDVYHELKYGNGVDVARYRKILRHIVDETKTVLPDVKMILCEPFILHGSEVDGYGYEKMNGIRSYARTVKEIAENTNAEFVSLQSVMDEAAGRFGEEAVLSDGIHPTVFGAHLIAEAWLKKFEQIRRETGV